MKSNILYRGILLALGLFSSSCDPSKSPTSFEEKSDKILFEMASRMEKNANYSMALQYYQKVLDKDAKNVSAKLGIAKCLREMGDSQKALRLLQDVSKEASETFEIEKEIGKNYILLHNLEGCQKTYAKLYTQAPEDLNVLTGRGVCCDLGKKHAEAQKLYQKALSIDPDYLNAQSNLGLSLALSGHYSQAIEKLEALVQKGHANARDRQNLAVAYALSGNLEKASNLFSIDLPPESVRQNLASLHQLSQASPPSPVLPKTFLKQKNPQGSGVPPKPIEQTTLEEESKKEEKVSTPLPPLSLKQK